MKPGSGIILMKPSTHPAPGTHTPPATHLKPIFFQNAYQHRNLKFTMQTKFNKVKWSKKFGSNANAKFVLVTYVLVSSILDYQLSCKSGTHHIFRPKFFFQNNFWTPILSDPKFFDQESFGPTIFLVTKYFGHKNFMTQNLLDQIYLFCLSLVAASLGEGRPVSLLQTHSSLPGRLCQKLNKKTRKKFKILSENCCLWFLSGIDLSDLNLMRWRINPSFLCLVYSWCHSNQLDGFSAPDWNSQEFPWSLQWKIKRARWTENISECGRPECAWVDLSGSVKTHQSFRVASLSGPHVS